MNAHGGQKQSDGLFACVVFVVHVWAKDRSGNGDAKCASVDGVGIVGGTGNTMLVRAKNGVVDACSASAIAGRLH